MAEDKDTAALWAWFPSRFPGLSCLFQKFELREEALSPKDLFALNFLQPLLFRPTLC